jgi:cysteine synthase
MSARIVSQDRIGSQASDVVGNTPLVALNRLGEGLGAEVVAKLEYFNPGGSVKDRIGVSMIDAAEAEGRIEPGRSVIVEPTSGNTGIALAMVCAARGYRCILTLPEGMGRERSALLRTYGAVVRETPSLGGMNESVDLAREIVESTENAFMPQQFNNPANPEIHRRTTAEEIWRDLDGEVDAFVCGVGTGGTITGVGAVLKERRPAVHVAGVEPAGSAVLSGESPGPHKIQGIGPGFVPEVLDREVIDEVMPIEDEVAIDTARLAATREGLLVGISAGAALSAALDLASRREMAGKRIVAIVPDGGERYMSLPFFAPYDATSLSTLTACWASERCGVSLARSAPTSPRRAIATRPRATPGHSRSWPAGVEYRRFSRIVSPTRSTWRACRRFLSRSPTGAVR